MTFEAPNHTQTPNDFFDRLLPLINSMSELKVVLAIIRQTFGWHRNEDRISVTTFMKLTGLSRQGVLDGIAYALEHKIIEQRREGQECYYSLKVIGVDPAPEPETGEERPKWTVSDVYAQKERGVHSPVCVYCGFAPAGTVDHWLPKSKGGTDEDENLVACCDNCNRAKFTMTGDEYIQFMLERGWICDSLDRSTPLTSKQSKRLQKRSNLWTKPVNSLDSQNKERKERQKNGKKSRFLSGKYANDINH